MLDSIEIKYYAELCLFRFINFDELSCQEKNILKKKILRCLTSFDEVEDINTNAEYIWIKIDPDVDRQNFINAIKNQLRL